MLINMGFQIGHLLLTTLMITISNGALVSSRNYSLRSVVLSLLHTVYMYFSQ
jgi:hypothetical protein